MGFSEQAGRDGFLVARPTATGASETQEEAGNNWNDLREDTGELPAVSKGVDDVGFLLAVSDEIDRAIGVDRERVYMAGTSNGGIMTNTFACLHGDVVAAIATTVATLPATMTSCEKKGTFGVMMVNGTEDTVVLWEGGQLSGNRGAMLAIPETYERWREYQGCTSSVETVEEDVKIFRAEGCDVGVEVSLSGYPLEHIDAAFLPVADEIWEFFLRH